jgi:carboxymethylenebutenolidase
VLVSYYGSGIADRLEDASRCTCPAIFHFGEADAYLPVEQAQRIQAAFAAHSSAEIHMHSGAGHAFDNFRAPIFYNQAAAEASWPQTTDFLERWYPPA